VCLRSRLLLLRTATHPLPSSPSITPLEQPRHMAALLPPLQVFYCSAACATIDWHTHEPYCHHATTGHWPRVGCRASKDMWTQNGRAGAAGGGCCTAVRLHFAPIVAA